MGFKDLVHVFLVSFPGQGHVNPLLRLGKMLASKGLLVTFATSENIQKQLMQANSNSAKPSPIGDGFVRFEFFNVGMSNDDPSGEDNFFYEFARVGKEVLPSMVKKYEAKGEPISCFVNNPFIPWVSDVAYDLKIPSAMLWVQSCASFLVYYHHLQSLIPFPSAENPNCNVQLPFMPLLKYDEIPSFLQPKTAQVFIRDAILSQLKNLNKPFCVLVNTFYELEAELIDYMSKICPIRLVGPLIRNPSIATSSISGSLMKADDCSEWLDSKEATSVVYISFGSVVSLKQEQVIEIAYGLLSAGVNFLWVIRQPHKDFGLPENFLEEVGDRGKIVKWCSQEKVLSHQAIACFLTHCGWNSTLEVLSSGVPILAFPQWGDQVTNAKYLIDVFKVGFRMSRGEAEGRVIGREEVVRYLKEAMVADKMAEMKENALRWKEAAEAAVASGASTEGNILEFVEDIKKINGIKLD